MRKNEHPRCGCRSCKRGASTKHGQTVHRAVNRAIRHETNNKLCQLVKRENGYLEFSYAGHDDVVLDFDMVLVSTPYTD